MKKWDVNATVVGSKYLGEFRANTKQEAIDKAVKANDWISLCHQCASECEDAEIQDVTASEVK